MGKIVKTMKLRIDTDEAADRLFRELTERYASACNEISQYMFDHEFPMNFVELKNVMYHQLRDCYGLKSQMTLSSFKTVIARSPIPLQRCRWRMAEHRSDSGMVMAADPFSQASGGSCPWKGLLFCKKWHETIHQYLEKESESVFPCIRSLSAVF